MLKHYWALLGKCLANYVQGVGPEYITAWASTLSLGVHLPSMWPSTPMNPMLVVGTTVYEWPDVGDLDVHAAVVAAEAIIHQHQSSRPKISFPTKCQARIYR